MTSPQSTNMRFSQVSTCLCFKVVSVERVLSMLAFLLSQPMSFHMTPYHDITIVLEFFV